MSFEDEPHVNRSRNPYLLALNTSRRSLLKGGFAAFALSLPGVQLAGCAAAGGAASGTPGFASIPASTADALTVPPGYRVQVLYRWGEETGIAGAPPAPWREDASSSADEQALQAGMHHDGMHFFPLPQGSGRADRGLLVLNHEYTDDGLLHADGMKTWTAEKVRKSQHAHGVSVIELERRGTDWRLVRPSRWARRITARTPMAVGGPAAGHALLRTAADPKGVEILGTLNNCAHGHTPWGTYLTCEENFNLYFANPSGGADGVSDPDARQRVLHGQSRYGITRAGRGGYRWHEHDERFDAGRHPNEPHRFGWVVEIDPFDPQSRPVKRTALGRFKHEGAWTVLANDGRVVVYMGDDERFEYIYKFVSRHRYDPADRAASLRLLDEGTLYVARYDEGGHGRWLPLVHGQGPLTTERGFGSQAEVLIRARDAGDALGATKMDRPEWIATHPVTGEVFVTLTNNSERGRGSNPGADAANPRVNNVFGHIVRWRELGGDAAATGFRWSIFALAGDPKHEDPARRGNIAGDAYGSPDGLWFDARGLLWIQTDVAASALNRGDYARLGNNQMLAADPYTGETRRFLVGPVNCEVTGVVDTPDGRSLFVNIQHPGESPGERADPGEPRRFSNWPDFGPRGRPRSATVVISREDGGIIGT